MTSDAPIAELYERLVARRDAGDASGVAALFASDGELTTFSGAVRGSEALHAWWAGTLAGGGIEVVSTDVVVEAADALYAESLVRHGDGTAFLYEGICTSDGRITHHLSNVAAGPVPVVDEASSVRTPLDTDLKRFFADHVACLDAGEADRLVATHYADDGIVMSKDFTVEGAEALRAHFTRVTGFMGFLEVVSVDAWVESDDTYMFESTARTQGGVARVHDAFVVQGGRVRRHFTGVLPAG